MVLLLHLPYLLEHLLCLRIIEVILSLTAFIIDDLSVCHIISIIKAFLPKSVIFLISDAEFARAVTLLRVEVVGGAAVVSIGSNVRGGLHDDLLRASTR